MPTIAPEAVVTAGDGVLATTVDDELVVLDPEGGTYHGLQGVGPFVWNLIQKPTTISRVVEAVAAEYDVSAVECEDEITAFVRDLLEADLAEVVDGPDR